MKARSAIVAAVMVSACAMGSVTAHAGTKAKSPAWFNGRLIDLAVDWEGAGACNIAPEISLCFDTEREMDEAVRSSDLLIAELAESIQPFSTCVSSMRLYDGTSYTSTVLNLSTQGVYLNLSAYGFDNLTSSYKVGACTADMYSSASGGGTNYPGNTAANAQSPSMSTGWNNTVSSVYIN